MSDLRLPARASGAFGLAQRSQAGPRVEFLAFLLGGEPYALPIGLILEILKPLPITEVPRAPKEVAGVMSVRGRLVTVFDLRQRFGLRIGEIERKARVLLVDGGEETVGLLVGEVLQVYRLAESQIEPPSVLGREPAPHIAGVGRHDELLFLLLDLRPILGF